MLEQFFEYEENKEVFKDYKSRQKWAECPAYRVQVRLGSGRRGKRLSNMSIYLLNLPQHEQSGLMRSPFILQVFATHLNSIVGAEDVPSLEVTDGYGAATVLARYPPKGALALAAAAVSFFFPVSKYLTLSQVERTLRLWGDGEMQPLGVSVEQPRKQSNKPSIKATTKLNPQTGIISNTQSKFSAENWGTATSNYLRSIEKMKEGSLEEIVALAEPFMSPLKSRRQETSRGPQSITGGNSQDVRACLVDEWYAFSPVMF